MTWSVSFTSKDGTPIGKHRLAKGKGPTDPDVKAALTAADALWEESENGTQQVSIAGDRLENGALQVTITITPDD